MNVIVVLPPDYIGAAEVRFAVTVLTESPSEALTLTRSQLETCLLDHDGLSESGKRSLTIGDVLIVCEQCHIVEVAGFRAVSRSYCENWLRRSLVERLIGSGEYERIRANHSVLAPAVVVM